jgi:hypothetical protein
MLQLKSIKQSSVDMQLQQFYTNITPCQFEFSYGSGSTKIIQLRNFRTKEILCRIFVITAPAPLK